MKFIKKLNIIICFIAVFTLSNQTTMAQSACMTVSYEADYNYYQLHGSNTSSRISQIINEVERIYQNSGIDLNITTSNSNIIRSSSEDPYGISSISNFIGTVLDRFISRGYANSSNDVALLFTGKRLSNHGGAYPNTTCVNAGSSCVVGIGVNKNSGARLSIQQEAQIHAHEICHLLTDGGHEPSSSIMNANTPYVGATRFNSNRINLIKAALNRKSCLSCGNTNPNPPVANNNCTLTVSNPTGCEFYFTVNNITYSLPANGSYIFNVANGASYSLLYTNWSTIESRTVSCSNPNYSIRTSLCGGGVVTNTCSSPSYVTASGVTSNACNLSWDNGSGATSYVLYQLVNSSWYKLADAYGNSIGIGGMASGSGYTFAIESVCNGIGSGSYTQTTIYTTNFRTGDNVTLNANGSNELFVIENNTANLSIENNLAIHPNPIKNTGNIDYIINSDSEVTLYISDLMGRKVAELIKAETKIAGRHQAKFDGSQFAEGVYYCTIEAGNFLQTKKLVITK